MNGEKGCGWPQREASRDEPGLGTLGTGSQGDPHVLLFAIAFECIGTNRSDNPAETLAGTTVARAVLQQNHSV